MKKLIYSMLTVIIIGAAVWWGISIMNDRKEPINQSDAFVYAENSVLQWFDLSIRNETIKGTFNEKKIIEEIGKVPVLAEHTYKVTGTSTTNGYELQVQKDGSLEKYDAWFANDQFHIRSHIDGEIKILKGVKENELKKYMDDLQEQLDIAVYHSEKKEKDRIQKFFNDLRSKYGFLYRSDDESFQVFIKIDEAYLEGELSGTLTLMEKIDGQENPYKETKYEINGITDGLMINLYTTVDGKTVKMEGNFPNGADSFLLTFWMTEKEIMFLSVTEEEYKQSYEEFKTK